MKHSDYIKAAKELNQQANTTIKVVAVTGKVLQEAIKETVKSLIDFDFSILSPATLDVFDDLKCEMIEEETENPSNVIPIKKDQPKERTLYQQGPALIAAATDLIDVLGYDKEDIEKFKKLSLMAMVTEVQKMADVINLPYEQDDKMITPDDKPSDFKPDTIKVFEENSIKVKWNDKPKLSVLKDPEKVKPESKKKEEKEKPVVDKKKDDKPVTKKKKQMSDPSKSNKGQVFLKWNNGKGETDIKKLHSHVKEAVKENTIKGWLNQWKNGKNLPAVASK